MTPDTRAEVWAKFMAADMTHGRTGGPGISAQMADKALDEFDQRFNCPRCEGTCKSPTHHGKKRSS